MRSPRIRAVARLVDLAEPVLIAPRGADYHDAEVVARSWEGPTAWRERPRCGAHAVRWVAVDLNFAKMLDRAPCPSCASVEPTITDAEEAPEPSPESPGPDTKEQP